MLFGCMVGAGLNFQFICFAAFNKYSLVWLGYVGRFFALVLYGLGDVTTVHILVCVSSEPDYGIVWLQQCVRELTVVIQCQRLMEEAFS